MNGFAAMALAFMLSGCGHGHGHDDHGHGDDEGPSLAITKWTDRYELFVELPVPAPGKPVPYHAHVTRLSDFFAVTEGTFRVRYKNAAGIAREASQVGTKRPGIFVFEHLAPPAGTYALEMVYEHNGESDIFDCGSVTVTDKPVEGPEGPASVITFLKESQWKIPFATAWAGDHLLANEMELPATVEPAATDQLMVGAPTDGRFFHNPKLSLAEGLEIKKGDVLGTIVPTIAGADYSQLQFAFEEARLRKEQLQQELTRVEPLVRQGLLPERRLIELRNELEFGTAQLLSAAGRIDVVTKPGARGGLPIRSTLDGVISQVLAPNGEPVEAGAPLVRIGGSDDLWIRARFVAKPASLFVDPKPTSARLPSGEEVDLESIGARFLSSRPVVDSASRVATWIVDVLPEGIPGVSPVAQASTPDLRPGTNVVLSLRFGEPTSVLAVPKDAVVEINTRPYVFVQVDGEHFEKRPVTLGQSDGPWTHIRAGVAKGERVVTKGGFDIHLASLMGTIESHRH